METALLAAISMGQTFCKECRAGKFNQGIVRKRTDPDEGRPVSLITGFHQDEDGHWVVELSCGHTQHLRHQPPWQARPWVLDPASANAASASPSTAAGAHRVRLAIPLAVDFLAPLISRSTHADIFHCADRLWCRPDLHQPGLVRTLERAGLKVGFFKPIAQPHPGDTGPERSTELVARTHGIKPPSH
jgi:hypothetical protein